ncbi:hypothetical protein [Fulvivirga lutea]|uniref:Uncharacterized protein n=1 Tax=Fulvivirga lutea TaxID=2810512 RepID=A0A975A186_9BACT|nr:hypothetical protein [Fulvivirga lutea]QSE98031.1 hypothetical protein JR347_02820 [Fulvivirga lutea]
MKPTMPHTLRYSAMKYVVAVLFLVLFGCQLDSDKAINRDKFTFKIGSDTQLFFKNVRQSYYDLEENKAANFNVFRLSKRVQSVDRPLLNLAIVINYRQDEAYLLLEPSMDLAELPITIIAEYDSIQTRKEITLAEQNRESTLHFAADLYESILAGGTFYIRSDSTDIPILTSQQEREAFRITVSDYFRLTRVY